MRTWLGGWTRHSSKQFVWLLFCAHRQDNLEYYRGKCYLLDTGRWRLGGSGLNKAASTTTSSLRRCVVATLRRFVTRQNWPRCRSLSDNLYFGNCALNRFLIVWMFDFATWAHSAALNSCSLGVVTSEREWTFRAVKRHGQKKARNIFFKAAAVVVAQLVVRPK